MTIHLGSFSSLTPFRYMLVHNADNQDVRYHNNERLQLVAEF